MHLVRVLLLVCLGLTAGKGMAGAPLEQALAAARSEGRPVLLNFSAPWCYSCYYMSQQVLTGAEWQAAQSRMRLVTLDADAPEGHREREQRQVGAIPSYLLLDGEGTELGRIVGEQSRADFYRRLDELLAQGATQPERDRQVRQAEPAVAAAAAVSLLSAHHARRDPEGGLAWWQALPPDRRAQLAQQPGPRHWHARLVFQHAAASGDTAACLATGEAVLADAALGCDRAYELPRYLRCTEGLAPAQRQTRLAAQRPALTQALEAGLLPGTAYCADERSLVMAVAGLYHALGVSDEADAVLEARVAAHRSAIGDRWRDERYRADNLRVYLEALGDLDGVEAVLQSQVAAFPEEYIYAFRLGRLRIGQGRHEAALEPLALAAAQAYGINRLRVAEQRVVALQALGRESDARRIAAQALRASGPWFPELQAALRQQVGLPAATR